MIRSLVTLASAISLLLCIGLAVMWARSERAAGLGLIYHSRRSSPAGEQSRMVISSRGYLACYRYEQTEQPATAPRGHSSHLTRTRGFGPLRISVEHTAFIENWTRITTARVSVVVRYYLLAAITGVLPLAWAIVVIRRHRGRALARAGRCRTCGYDLRASKERCPECGNSVPMQEAERA